MRIKFGPAFSGANILKEKENKNGTTEKPQCYEVRFGEGDKARIHRY